MAGLMASRSRYPVPNVHPDELNAMECLSVARPQATTPMPPTATQRECINDRRGVRQPPDGFNVFQAKATGVKNMKRGSVQNERMALRKDKRHGFAHQAKATKTSLPNRRNMTPQ